MPQMIAHTQIRWSLQTDVARGLLSARYIDSMTQETSYFDIPLRGVPGLLTGLQELIDRHPDKFPTELFNRVTHSGDGT